MFHRNLKYFYEEDYIYVKDYFREKQLLIFKLVYIIDK